VKINLKCPLCGKEGSGDVPDDLAKQRNLTDDQTLEIPCPDCINDKMVGAIAGAEIETQNLCIGDKNSLQEKVEAMREYHKKMLKKEKEVPPVLFTVSGEKSHIFMLNSVMDDKDKAETCIKSILAETKAEEYYMVTEAWQGTKLDVMPSEDPDRKEILLVYGQEQGAIGMMDSTPFVKFDNEIRFTGPSTAISNAELTGRFINLLPTE